MSTTYQLFTKWKEAKGFTSDYQGATALGLGRAAVSQWKSGRNAEAHLIAKMATEIGEDKGAWMAAVQAEKTHSESEKKAWSSLAKKLGYAAVIALTCTALTPTAGHAEKAATTGYSESHGSMRLYIMRTIR